MTEQEILKIATELQKIRDRAILLRSVCGRLSDSTIKFVDITQVQLNDYNYLIGNSLSLSEYIIRITEVGYIK
jgi:hypothetical protein